MVRAEDLVGGRCPRDPHRDPALRGGPQWSSTVVQCLPQVQGQCLPQVFLFMGRVVKGPSL